MTRVLLLPVLLASAAACAVTPVAVAPRCTSVERVALVAQSVPTASYVPCVRALPVGWRVPDVDVERGSTRLSLLSDRSGGRPVEVLLTSSCDVDGASPVTPRADGVRSHLRLRSVRPRFAGTSYDVFPGGCVSATFSFPTGPHIPLMEDLASIVELLPRRELRHDVREQLGVELDP